MVTCNTCDNEAVFRVEIERLHTKIQGYDLPQGRIQLVYACGPCMTRDLRALADLRDERANLRV